MKQLTPCLWFDSQAEEAAEFYTAIFKNSKIGKITRYGEAMKEIHGRPSGSVMTIEFELNGQKFLGLNGGPVFKFNEAVSFQVICESQEEVDYYWERLGEGGDPAARQCGWLKDKFGLSWQIVPAALGDLLSGGEAARSERVMTALHGMKKLDIAALKRAYDNN